MRSLVREIRAELTSAMVAAFGEAVRGEDPLVRVAGDPKFGDYQSNVAMGLAKKLTLKPRDAAIRIVEGLSASSSAAAMLEPPEIAGPGFINLRVKTSYLAMQLSAVGARPTEDAADRLGIEPIPPEGRDRVVIDYSSPNVAKQMHVGHLRSTIIGDVISRVLEFQGHAVFRQNHIGDWGTQFGMVVLGMWHLFMASRRGRSASDLARLSEDLRGPDAIELLKSIRDQQETDVASDMSGEQFRDWLQNRQPDFEDLLVAYRFVNTLEKAAESTDLKVHDPAHGEDIPLASVSNHTVKMLQRGLDRDQSEYAAWRISTVASMVYCEDIYRRLGVRLSRSDVRGESFFNPLLAAVVEELRTALPDDAAHFDFRAASAEGTPHRAVCRDDKGAVCVFIEQADGTPAFKGADGNALPMIVRKSDGAYLYASTDLAAAAFRINDFQRRPIHFKTSALPEGLRNELSLSDADPAAGRGGLGGTRVLYVVGSPQRLHFEMLFSVVRAMGWTRPGDGTRDVRLEHVMFGSVLGTDRKMLRTRTGESVRLKDLLDEAVLRASALLDEGDAKRVGEPWWESLGEDAKVRWKNETAQVVGIAAVKYADLCQNRNTDYVFAWDKMLAMQGNTAPYLLYAHARIRSIYRKGAEAGIAPSPESRAQATLHLDAPAERDLAIGLRRFPEVLDSVGESLLPNHLCEYLFDLAGRFMAFYENCPVLKAPEPAVAASRLQLCDLTARALKLGLGLMGIQTLERM